MASLKDHESGTTSKVLVIGDSGAGKTALLATLANAGYNLRILDFDNGLATMLPFVGGDAIDNVHYETLRDQVEGTRPDAWLRAKKLLWTGWKTDTEDLGKVKEWGPEDVLVIDSLTFMGDAIRHKILADNGSKIYDKVTISEWGDTVRILEAQLDMFTSDHIKCNVVMTALPQLVEDDSGLNRVFPMGGTKNFSTKISRYFTDAVISIRSKRDGSKFLRTQSDHKMDLKNTAPSVVPVEMEADLAKLFKMLQGEEVDV